jgi:hypothetical protein
MNSWYVCMKNAEWPARGWYGKPNGTIKRRQCPSTTRCARSKLETHHSGPVAVYSEKYIGRIMQVPTPRNAIPTPPPPKMLWIKKNQGNKRPDTQQRAGAPQEKMVILEEKAKRKLTNHVLFSRPYSHDNLYNPQQQRPEAKMKLAALLPRLV